MLVLKAGLDRELFWIAKRDDPDLIPVSSPTGWAIVSPLVPVSPILAPGPAVLSLADDTAFIATNGIAIVVPEKAASDADAVSDLLKRLRYVTGQATLPQEPAITTYEEVDALPTSAFPPAGQAPAGQLREFLRATAITRSAVEDAGSQATAEAVPVYSTMLLDAIQAAEQFDFQKAILYSAVAVEAMAGTQLDREYERLRHTLPEPAHVRIVKHTVRGGDVVRKDPIFQALREAARRSFKYLLHELPLYLYNRSLLVENQQLYQRAIVLHDTRNDLAHTGSIKDSSKRLSLDRAGAFKAIDTARLVFEWFREPGKYLVPYTVIHDLSRRNS